MNALSELLSKIENASPTQRDKGTTFENLCVQFFLHEPKYAELYSDVLSYAGWIAKYGEVILTRHIQTVFVSTLVLSVGSGIPSARGIPGRCADGFHCNARTLPPGLSTPFSHSVLA